LLAYDYTGYGLNPGQPSEKHCFQDILAVYQYIIDTLHFPADKIFM
jgi:hypothetical protein